MASPGAEPISIPSSNAVYSSTPSDIVTPRSEGVEVPPNYLPRARENSVISLDVFHHPAELHTPTTEPPDPLSVDPNMTSPRLSTGSPSIGFDAARSPVLAIHHSRGPLSEDDNDLDRSISGLSLSTDLSPPRRTASVTNDTTYVPLTPLPSHCILSFLDRPREFAALKGKNTELFTLIEHALSRDKYAELQALWKAPREVIPDENWVYLTRSYIAMGPDEGEGGALWTRWRELVGWEPSPSPEDVEDEEDWNYQPQDSSLRRQWNSFDKERDDGTWGSAIGLSGSGAAGLSEIQEGEEEELEEGEHRLGMGSMSRKS